MTIKVILIDTKDKLWSIFEELRPTSLQVVHCMTQEMVIPISHNITYEKDTNLGFNDLLSLADTKNVLKYEKKNLIKKEINGLLIATCTK